jgi:Aspartyl/Asparaginyl beta-hydroxylase
MADPVQVQFPDRLRLALNFDPGRLEEDLGRLHGCEWTSHFVKQNYDGDWSAMALRAQAGATHPIMMIYSSPTAKAFADTPLLEHTPYFRELLAAFKCPLGAVRLMRLAPGSIIKEHKDDDLAFERGAVRLHLPITTNPQVEFMLNGSRVVMAPGSAWYLRLSDPHSVSNKGATDRVHLVIDALANDWLAAALHRAA